MKTALLLLLCSASFSFAQTTIIIQGGIGARTPLIPLENSSSIEDSWKSSHPATIGIEHFVLKSIAIISGVEYNYYSFKGYGGTQVDDGPPSITGDASQIYRLSLEGKFIASPDRNFSLYLVTGTCYSIERIGSIHLKSWYSNTVNNIPGQSEYYWMQTLGLGWRCSFSDDFGIDLTGRLYSDYSAHFHESLMLGFFYAL
ncbi:MAG: hypothetical protein WBZ48_09620 [Bacteroidota bacterium]